jgi:DNA polymerase-1
MNEMNRSVEAAGDEEANQSKTSHNKGHLCVIDGSNMLHRAWAMAPSKKRQDGMEVGATHLFGMMMMKLLRRMLNGRKAPTHLVIFFDPPRDQSWRREVYEGYKADRAPMDEDLRLQIPLMKEMCAAMGVAHGTAPRHEADDLIGAYVEDAVERGDFCSIVSTDKDLMQLVRPGVMQLNTVQDKWFNNEEVARKFGVKADQLGDYLALAGDKVDGVPGAPGIGPKSAKALLEQFDDLEAMLNRCDEIERKSWRKIVSENRDIILLSRVLVALDCSGSPRPVSLQSMRAPTAAQAWIGLEEWREKHLV